MSDPVLLCRRIASRSCNIEVYRSCDLNVYNNNFPLKEKRGHRYQFGHSEVVGMSVLLCFPSVFCHSLPLEKIKQGRCGDRRVLMEH